MNIEKQLEERDIVLNVILISTGDSIYYVLGKDIEDGKSGIK